MTLARRVVPGTTLLLTRRTSDRRFLFVPSPEIREIFGYCLAYQAEQHKMSIHAAVALSNHWHIVATDTDGNQGDFPDTDGNQGDFLRDTHSMIARCVNKVLGRDDSVWGGSQPSAVELGDLEALWGELVYTLGNAVSSGLVASHKAWPGFHTEPSDVLGTGTTFKRPAVFFSSDTDLPDEVTLTLTKPPALDDLSDADYAKQLKRRLKKAESKERRVFKSKGRDFLGIKRVLDQNPFDSPRTPASKSRISPRVACKDKKRRIALLDRLADFQNTYREAPFSAVLRVRVPGLGFLARRPPDRPRVAPFRQYSGLGFRLGFPQTSCRAATPSLPAQAECSRRSARVHQGEPTA